MQQNDENIDKESVEVKNQQDNVESSDKSEEAVGSENETSLEEQVASLEAKLAEQKDLTLRAKADLENFRRRAQEDLEAAHKYAMNKFITSILPVKDNLEMALADESGQFENMKFGVDLTLKEFQSAFNNAHVEEISPQGEKLDPHLHQAMQMEESNEVEPNTILRVLKKGYKVDDRLLRPALVIVAKAKEE